MPAGSLATYGDGLGIRAAETGRKESAVMFHPNQLRTGEALALVVPASSGACLVAGCACKDARIVSHRRAAFFAAVARQTGQTADRIIIADPDWRIPAPHGV